MATWRTALNLSQTQVTALGDQLNYLGNTTSENVLKLSEVVTRVGALGQTAGLSAGEVAALAASMPGVTAEISATQTLPAARPTAWIYLSTTAPGSGSLHGCL